MREALAEADIAAREGEVPIGAVVVYEGKVIARAHNRRELDEDPSAHAEFSAMLEAARALGRWRLSGCTVYVTLEPCCMCAGLMVNARIDRCVYGARDSKGGAVGTLYNLAADPRLNHRFSVTAGVLEDECAEVLRSFFGTLRNRATAGGQDGSDASAPPAEASRRRGAAAPACGFASGQDGADACTAKAAAGKARGRAQALERAVVGPGGVRPRRVLVALDSFKGSASSEQANAWLAEGLHRGNPELAVETLPVGDGGEGTASALASALGAERRVVRCHDLAGREVEASYLLFDESDESEAAQVLGNNAGRSSGRGAFIEMAQVAGLALSDTSESMALAGSTRGVGELLLDAVGQGASTLYLCLGGSATSDGGSGMLSALGARLLNDGGDPIQGGLPGFVDVAQIDLAPALQALAHARLVALCDVTNPLVGPRGAIKVFGVQKGLAPDSLDELDRRMIRYGSLLDAAVRRVGDPQFRSLPGVPGAGAAGGVGAAVLALGGTVTSGIDAVLDLVGFDASAREADVVITGEGMLDEQSAAGKTPVGVARRAREGGRPTIAVVGGRAECLDAVYRSGIDFVLPIIRQPMPLKEAMTPEQTRANLVCAGETLARLLSW